jgi:hypothetical protein
MVHLYSIGSGLDDTLHRPGHRISDKMAAFARRSRSDRLSPTAVISLA